MHQVSTINERHVKGREGERGNVLFLILIAVALFAALSYAVTQSTRSGAGSSDNETGLINSAQLTQYPAGVRTAVVRMIIGGVSVETLSFNVPSDFTNLGSNTAYGVFHPTGGGATYANAPADVMSNGLQGEWRFNAVNQINLIGQTNATTPEDGVDIIAFLPGVSQGVCRKINEELGITGIPAETDAAYLATDNMVASAGGTTLKGIDDTGGIIGDTASSTNELNGQPFGCFDNSGVYVYYHVLVER